MRVLRVAVSAVTFGIAFAVHAAALEIESTFSGGFYEDGTYSSGTMNYYVGYEVPSSPPERRNWFVFDLTGVTEPVVDAALKLYLPGDSAHFEVCGYISIDTEESYVVTSTPVPYTFFVDAFTGMPPIPPPTAGVIFGTLGMGIPYFVTTVSAPFCGTDIVLDATPEGLAAINTALGDHFVAGGRLPDLHEPPAVPPVELVFAYTDIGPSHPELPFPRLELTLAGDPTPTPVLTPPATETPTPTVTPTDTATPVLTTTPTPTATPTGCPLAPASGCYVPGASVLQIANATADAKDRFIWGWLKGPALAREDFGDPTAGDDYDLCVYEDDTPKAAVALPGGTGWSTIGTKGYKYAEVSTTVLHARLLGDAEGKSRVLSRSKGVVSLPAAPGSPLFAPGSSITVQLHGAGHCWSSTFSGAEIVKSTHDGVRAKE